MQSRGFCVKNKCLWLLRTAVCPVRLQRMWEEGAERFFRQLQSCVTPPGKGRRQLRNMKTKHRRKHSCLHLVDWRRQHLCLYLVMDSHTHHKSDHCRRRGWAKRQVRDTEVGRNRTHACLPLIDLSRRRLCLCLELGHNSGHCWLW